MGKNSKKQRDQKRYDQEMEKLRAEQQTRHEAQKQERLQARSATAEVKGDQVREEEMPELKDLSTEKNSGGTAREEPKKKREMGDNVVWQPGEPPKSINLPKDGLDGAYKLLGFDSGFSFDDNDQSLHDMVPYAQRCLSNPNISTPELMGALLLIGCSQIGLDKENREFNFLEMIYTVEADRQLSQRRLPLPRGRKREDMFLPVDLSMLYSHALPRAGRLTDVRWVDTAETKTLRLKGEKALLERNVVARKAEVKEAFEARDAKEDENEKLRDDIARLKREKELEIERLREENAKLQALSSSLPPPTTSSRSSTGKSTFVIGALSKQVKELSRELKEKNEQLAELMIELTKSV